MSKVSPITYCHWEVTWNCNQNCKMCPRNLFGPVGKRLNMSMKMFNNILSQLPNLRQANFAGLGEPFMHPNLLDMFDILGKKNVDIMMTTNGTMLNEETIKRLPNVRMQIHVSIDSPIENTFKKIRGYDLNNVLDNLRMLKKLRPDIRLVIQSLFMKNTMREFIYFIPILKELNASLAILYPISFKHEDEYIYEPFMEEDFKEVKNAFSRLAKSEGISIYDRPPHPLMKVCNEPFMGPMINPKGEVFSCCYIYEARNYPDTPISWEEWYLNKKVDVPQHEYCMGNINEESLESIWNKEEYNELRNMVLLCNKTHLSSEVYRELRDNIDLSKKRFSYCRICLWRYNQSC